LIDPLAVDKEARICYKGGNCDGAAGNLIMQTAKTATRKKALQELQDVSGIQLALGIKFSRIEGVRQQYCSALLHYNWTIVRKIQGYIERGFGKTVDSRAEGLRLREVYYFLKDPAVKKFLGNPPRDIGFRQRDLRAYPELLNKVISGEALTPKEFLMVVTGEATVAVSTSAPVVEYWWADK
jgi:hypothetical protein